jgi:hypothetical protein
VFQQPRGVHPIKGLVLKWQTRSVSLDVDSRGVVHVGYAKRLQLNVDGEERDVREARCRLRRHGSDAAAEVENAVSWADMPVF